MLDRRYRQLSSHTLRSLLSNSSVRVARSYDTRNATSSARMDALAGPGIVPDNQYEDRNSEKWVNKPTERRRHDVEQDADNGPQYRRKEGCWQIRLHEFRVAVQMRKDGESRRRHQPGYQGVKHYGRLLIHKTIVAERACEYYVGVIWLNLHYMFVRLCIKVDLTLRRTQPHRPSRKTSPSGVLPPQFSWRRKTESELRRRLCRRRSGDGFPNE